MYSISLISARLSPSNEIPETQRPLDPCEPLPATHQLGPKPCLLGNYFLDGLDMVNGLRVHIPSTNSVQPQRLRFYQKVGFGPSAAFFRLVRQSGNGNADLFSPKMPHCHFSIFSNSVMSGLLC